MKRKVTAALSVLLTLCMLLPLCGQALQVQLPEVTESNSSPYADPVLGYSFRIPDYLTPLPEEYEKLLLDEQNKEKEFGDEEWHYDVQAWFTPVSSGEMLFFEVTLKKCSNESFENEVAQAPYYAENARKQFSEAGRDAHITMLHDGILRETPAGQMLEIAVIQEETLEDGTQSSELFIYYDFYCNTIEYIFALTAPSRLVSYESMQKLLDSIVNTAEIQHVLE